MKHFFALRCAALAIGSSVLASAQTPPPSAPPAGDAPPSAPPEALPPTAATAGSASTPELSPPGPSDAEKTRVVVLDARTDGVNPLTGVIVTHRLRRTVDEMGYAVVSEADTRAAILRLGILHPPSDEEVRSVAFATSSRYGVYATISAASGKYVTHITVAPAGSASLPRATGTSGAEDLRAVVDGLLRGALPPPGAPVPSPPAVAMPQPSPVHAPAPEPKWKRRIRWAAQTEAAYGLTRPSFYNHLVGMRGDIRFTPTVALGAYVAYANLKGPSGRAHNVLAYLQADYHAPISSDLAVPLRLGSGYLPRNGPVLRGSAGLAYSVSPTVDIGADLLAPTAWITHDKTIVSLDVALEIAVTP